MAIQCLLGRQNHVTIEAIELSGRYAAQSSFFRGKHNRRVSSNAGAAKKRGQLVACKLWARPHQAQITAEYVKELGQLIEFPTAHERSDRREYLI